MVAAAPRSFAGSTSDAPFSNPDDRIQLKVRTANDDLDAEVYEGVFEAFSAVMPLERDPPFSSGLEVTFSTAGHDWLGGERGRPATNVPTTAWYVGGRHPEDVEPVPRGVKWQTSQLRAVLRRADGSRAWSATYAYNGGLELSGWVVKTPAQAARLIARRLAARFKADSEARLRS
jgi:hypothetical protein